MAAETAAAPAATAESSKTASQQTGKPADAKPAGLAQKAAANADGSGGAPAEAPAEEKHTPNPKVREFAALTRKERELKSKEREVKAMIQRQQQEAQHLGELRKLRESKNPDAWMKAGGFTYDQLTEHYVRGGKDEEEAPTGASKEAIERASRAEQRVAELEKQLRQREEAKVVAEYIDDIKRIAQSDPDLELVCHYEAWPDVYELIDLHYQETGEILDKQEAAKQIEDVLLEMKSEEGKKLLAAKKLKQRLGLPVEPSDSEEGSSEQSPSPSATGTKTLTNELTASSAGTPPGRTRPPTDEERWAALIARARAGE